MAGNIDCGFIVRAMLALPPLAREQKELVLRRAVQAIGLFEGVGFEGEDPRSRDFLQGGKPGADMVVMLRHSRLSRLSDADNGWIKLSVADDGAKKPGYAFLSINVGCGENQIDLQWSVALQIAPRLVTALMPSVGFINAKRIDDEHYQALPLLENFNHPGLPTAITPWTYIQGARFVDVETRHQVEALPVFNALSLADGLALQVVDRLSDPPALAFVEALAQLRPHIRYISPQ